MGSLTNLTEENDVWTSRKRHDEGTTTGSPKYVRKLPGHFCFQVCRNPIKPLVEFHVLEQCACGRTRCPREMERHCLHLACHIPRPGCAHPFNTRRRRRIRGGDARKCSHCGFENMPEKRAGRCWKSRSFLFVKRKAHKLGQTTVPARLQTTAKGNQFLQDEGGTGLGRKERTTLTSQLDEGDASAATRPILQREKFKQEPETCLHSKEKRWGCREMMRRFMDHNTSPSMATKSIQCRHRLVYLLLSCLYEEKKVAREQEKTPPSCSSPPPSSSRSWLATTLSMPFIHDRFTSSLSPQAIPYHPKADVSSTMLG